MSNITSCASVFSVSDTSSYQIYKQYCIEESSFAPIKSICQLGESFAQLVGSFGQLVESFGAPRESFGAPKESFAPPKD